MILLNVDDFNFELPEELIAQTPLPNRASSRLLILDRHTKERKHETFMKIIDYLEQGDCLVLNDTRVLPARLYGKKEGTGAKIEVLLLHEKENGYWEALVKPAKRVPVGTTITFGNGELKAKCAGTKNHGGRLLKLSYDGILYHTLDKLGEMPLPPYIRERLTEKERYQTVYAKNEGSAAAPTAGLHFTEQLLKKIEEKGVKLAYVTLHVGLGTFRPVTADRITDHRMHEEYYSLSEHTARLLNKVKKENGRIIAVGTTTTRVLETIIRNNAGVFAPESGWTDIFIYPPYSFQGIDGLITNFHLPKSTLLMLISAFSDRETILKTYQEAIAKKYRFFSFGDAMLII